MTPRACARFTFNCTFLPPFVSTSHRFIIIVDVLSIIICYPLEPIYSYRSTRQPSHRGSQLLVDVLCRVIEPATDHYAAA